MNFEKACEILKLDTENLNLILLNNRYRKMALKHHPDKNGNTKTSNDQFKEINEAYNYLKNTLPETLDDQEEFEDNDIYLNVLKNFIKTVMDGNYVEIISKVTNDILNKSKKITFQIFEELDKDVALNVYMFLSEFKSILGLNKDLLENIKQIVTEKYKNVQIYKLNPSINDLIQNNFYKLYIDGNLFLVPLWANVSYFTNNSDGEIIVICEPDLPINMDIDENNNLIVKIELSAYYDLPKMIIDGRKNIEVEIGEQKFNIPFNKLHTTRVQYYCLKSQGLVNVKKELYDLSDKSDIIVEIKFI